MTLHHSLAEDEATLERVRMAIRELQAGNPFPALGNLVWIERELSRILEVKSEYGYYKQPYR